jgi:hypothetical protein
LVWYQGFCSPYFTAEFRPHSQWKIGFFAPKICQIIPKLIGLIVSKNPDLVTISGKRFFYISGRLCAFHHGFLYTRSSLFFGINMSHNSHSYREVFQSVHTRNLEVLMRISIEGKDKLSDSHLDTLVHKFKNKKDRYMML